MDQWDYVPGRRTRRSRRYPHYRNRYTCLSCRLKALHRLDVGRRHDVLIHVCLRSVIGMDLAAGTLLSLA